MIGIKISKIKKQYLGGAFFSYCTIAFSIISGLVYTPWMIKTIGSAQYALYTLALSIINTFVVDFGLGGAVSKFLSEYYAKGEEKEANEFIGKVLYVFLIIAIFIAIFLMVFYFVIDGIYTKLTMEELKVFKRLYLIVSFYSVITIVFTPFNGILIANEKFIELKLCNFSQNVLNVTLIVLCLFMGGDVYSLVFINAIINIITIGVKYFIIKCKTNAKISFTNNFSGYLKRLINFSVYSTINSVAQRCIFNIMPTIIAATISAEKVTIFYLASSLEGYFYTFTQAINGMFLPKISRIYEHDENKNELFVLMCKVGKFHVYTIGILYIGFICIGKQFIELWMGTNFSEIYMCAILLILPSIIDTPQQVARTSLIVKEILREQSIVYMGMALINVALSLILLKKIGIIGAAISVCIAYLFRTIGFNILYRKYLSINIKAYFVEVYGKWLIVAIATMLIGINIIAPLEIEGWIGILSKAILISIVYGICAMLVKNFITIYEKINQ